MRTSDMSPTNEANWELTNPVETLSMFPSEINDTRSHPGVIRTTRTLSRLDTDTPITFESLPADAWLIAADSFEPPREMCSRGTMRLRRNIRKWQHLFASVFRPTRVAAVRAVRLWPFAIGVVSGIVAVNTLRSDPSPQIAIGPETSQKAIVTAALPEVATPDAIRHETPAAIEDDTPAVHSRAAAVKRPAPPSMSQQSKPRRAVAGTRFRGHLIIDSEPRGASVMINQRPVGVTPLELSRYPASSYAVWIQQDGYERWTAGILVPADKVTRVHAQLQRTHE